MIKSGFYRIVNLKGEYYHEDGGDIWESNEESDAELVLDLIQNEETTADPGEGWHIERYEVTHIVRPLSGKRALNRLKSLLQDGS